MQGVFQAAKSLRRFSHLCSLAADSAVPTSKSRQSAHCPLMRCGSFGFRRTTRVLQAWREEHEMLHDPKIQDHEYAH